MSVSDALLFALRDLKSSGRTLGVFAACLLLGVTLIAATGGLFHLVKDALLSDTRALFGGDLEVRHRQPLGPDVLEWLNSRGDVSLLAELRTMVATDSGFQIVQLQAVDDTYPLYGALEVSPARPLDEILNPSDGVYGAAFDPLLGEQLGVRPGDRLQIGALIVELRAVVERQPDRSLRAAWRGPPLLVSREALGESGLILPGSRVSWRYRVRTTASVDKLVREVADAFPDAEFEVNTFDGRGQRIGEVLGQLASGLLLIAVSALFIGGLGVFNSVHAYLQGKRETLATLRTLGLRDTRLAGVYLAQIVVLAIGASGAGVILGGALAFAGASVVTESIAVETKIGALLPPLTAALAFGVVTAITFALPALGAAVTVAPALLFRGDDAPPSGLPRPFVVATIGAGLVLLALLFVTLPDALFAGGFVVTVVALLAGFELLVRVLKAAAPALAEHPRLAANFVARLALTSLYRKGSPLRILLLSLGSALTLLVSASLVVFALLKTIDETIPRDAPDLVFYDVLSEQLPSVTDALEKQPGLAEVNFAPLVLGRLVAVNGASLKDSADTRRVLESRDEHKLTYRAGNIDQVVVEQGAWWPKEYSGAPLVAMEDREADQLGLAVGDNLEFDVLGQRVSAELVAIYGQRRYQARFWFEGIFSDGVLDPFITRHVGAARIDAAGTRAVRTELARAAPNIVTVDIRHVLAEARAILGKASSGLAVIAFVSLCASLLVLAGVVASAKARQLREAIVLHVIGARVDVIQRALQLEYVLMALVASVIAAIIGTVIAAAILHYRLELPASGHWWLGAILAIGISTCALAAGARYVLRELKLSPAAHLRKFG